MLIRDITIDILIEMIKSRVKFRLTWVKGPFIILIICMTFSKLQKFSEPTFPYLLKIKLWCTCHRVAGELNNWMFVYLTVVSCLEYSKSSIHFGFRCCFITIIFWLSITWTPQNLMAQSNDLFSIAHGSVCWLSSLE